MGDRLVITRRGSMLAHLETQDLIETGVSENDSGVMLASSELVVHRAIYQNSWALAVVHCHPPKAVALSLLQEEIVPVDSEASYLLHRVPVLETELSIGSDQMARVLSNALKQHKIVMLRGHGCFAIGHMLEEAFQWCSTLEAAATIICELRMLGGEVKDYRKGADQYGNW
jgi:L-fuculose-phosphate aldolase